MLFTTDKQTLEDLNVFGKHGSDSLYTIFHRCSTRGGAAILEEMFRYPMSNADAINKRSSIIRFFSEAAITFPFSGASFEAAETYLSNTDERTRLSAQEQSLGKKIGNLIAADAETKMLHQGIQALVTLIKEAQQFIQQLNATNTESHALNVSKQAEGTAHDAIKAYSEEQHALKTLLSAQPFSTVLNGKDKPAFAEMGELDALLRFRHHDQVQQFLRHLYNLDVYIAIGKVARERSFIFPKALPKEQQFVKLDNVFHPQVKNAVPNSLTITADGNLIFLTGANMAGKSTFMKTVSIALFLAHMGFPVAATAMEFAVFDGIYTTINLPDNLGMGASHFYAEVLRVKKMAQELSQSRRLFIVFDELFRGTNVKDAYEATIAVASGFALKQNSVFIISTHIIEAGDVLKVQCSNVSFHYLPTLMEGKKPVYTYKLEQGISSDRHGMVIINNEGILDVLRQGKKKQFKIQQA